MKRLMLLILLLIPFSLCAETFTFTPPTQWVNNTPLPTTDIIGYNVFIDAKFVMKIPSAPNSFDVTINPNNKTINMSTLTSNGAESDWSKTKKLNMKLAANPPVMK